MRAAKEIPTPTRHVTIFHYKERGPLGIIFRGLILASAKYFPSFKIKRGILRLTGMKLGRHVTIAPCIIDPIRPDLIEVGDYSIIGWDSMLLTHEIVRGRLRIGHIKIGNNVTIGARSLILPGVKIGDNAIVSAQSLVNKDVPSGATVGGVPAKKVSLRWIS